MKDNEYYLNQARIKHKNKDVWPGKSLISHLPWLKKYVEGNHIESILDWGCGKALFHPEEWKDKVTKYDKCISEFNVKPSIKFGLVICTDVLEHIPMDSVEDAIREILNYRAETGLAYFSICCRPAWQKLPDGTQAHATVMPPIWWNKLFSKYICDDKGNLLPGEKGRLIVKYNGTEYWGAAEKACGKEINKTGSFWLMT